MAVPAIKVAWPEELQWIARALSTIALDWPVVTFSLQCVRPLLYYDVLRGTLLVALPLVAGVFVHFWLISILCCCFCSTTTLVRFRARCTNVYLLLVFVLYAPVSLTIVKYFHCRDFSGGMFLMADPALRSTTRCTSGGRRPPTLGCWRGWSASRSSTRRRSSG